MNVNVGLRVNVDLRVGLLVNVDANAPHPKRPTGLAPLWISGPVPPQRNDPQKTRLSIAGLVRLQGFQSGGGLGTGMHLSLVARALYAFSAG